MRKFNVTINGKSYQVEVEELTENNAPQKVLSQPALVPQPQPQPQVTDTAKGNITIKSPMPGTIVKVLISDGQTVKEGDVLFVLEAMKMENDIISSASGKISLKVSQGANVVTGDTLATIA